MGKILQKKLNISKSIKGRKKKQQLQDDPSHVAEKSRDAAQFQFSCTSCAVEDECHWINIHTVDPRTFWTQRLGTYAPPVGLDSTAICYGQEQYCKPGKCLDTDVSMGYCLCFPPLLLTLILGTSIRRSSTKLLSILYQIFPCSTLTMRHRYCKISKQDFQDGKKTHS